VSMLCYVSDRHTRETRTTNVLRPLWVAAPAAKKRASIYGVTPAGYIMIEPSIVSPTIYVSMFITIQLGSFCVWSIDTSYSEL
jgi:hypothetical protein